MYSIARGQADVNRQFAQALLTQDETRTMGASTACSQGMSRPAMVLAETRVANPLGAFTACSQGVCHPAMVPVETRVTNPLGALEERWLVVEDAGRRPAGSLHSLPPSSPLSWCSGFAPGERLG